MKQKDIVIVVAIAFISAIFSFAIAQYIFGGQKSYNLKSPTVAEIKPDFNNPDPQYFNSSSLNITRDIQIGDSANNQPFKASQ